MKGKSGRREEKSGRGESRKEKTGSLGGSERNGHEERAGGPEERSRVSGEL